MQNYVQLSTFAVRLIHSFFMNASEELQEWAKKDVDNIADFDQLEKDLETKLEEQMADLQVLEEDREKIGNPDSLGDTVMNVIWEQFVNQIGVVAGEDFIKENRGMKLDLRDSAHIQTTENFENGRIATHNDKIDYKKRYDDWQGQFQRNEDGSIKTKKDNRTGEERPELRVKDRKKDPNGSNYNYNYEARAYIDDGRPQGSTSIHKDYTVSADEIICDPATNAHLSREEHFDFANSDENLYDLDSSANQSKGSSKMTDWLDSERDGKKPAERFNIDEEELRERDRIAREEYEKQKKAGEQRSKETGKQSQKEEAIRIGRKAGRALRTVLMGMLASLVKDIIRQLVIWFRSGERKLSTFIDSVKEAFMSFLSNIKQHLLTAGDTLVTTIATAILGPVIGMIKKAWIFIKQGYKSVKDAIAFFKDPANKNMPFSLKMLNVGKIITAGLTAGGAIVLGEVIEKGLMTFPVFTINIPLFGSLASILGIFSGALVSGIIGALALNMINRLIAKKQKSLNTEKLIEVGNAINETQDKLTKVVVDKTKASAVDTLTNIQNLHTSASEIMSTSLENIKTNSEEIDKPLAEFANAKEITDTEEKTGNEEKLGQIYSDLQDL